MAVGSRRSAGGDWRARAPARGRNRRVDSAVSSSRGNAWAPEAAESTLDGGRPLSLLSGRKVQLAAAALRPGSRQPVRLQAGRWFAFPWLKRPCPGRHGRSRQRGDARRRRRFDGAVIGCWPCRSGCEPWPPGLAGLPWPSRQRLMSAEPNPPILRRRTTVCIRADPGGCGFWCGFGRRRRREIRPRAMPGPGGSGEGWPEGSRCHAHPRSSAGRCWNAFGGCGFAGAGRRKGGERCRAGRPVASCRGQHLPSRSWRHRSPASLRLIGAGPRRPAGTARP